MALLRRRGNAGTFGIQLLLFLDLEEDGVIGVFIVLPLAEAAELLKMSPGGGHLSVRTCSAGG